MQKIIVFLGFAILFVACRKDPSSTDSENGSQLLDKIVRTTIFSNGLTYAETVRFEYDNAKRIITEGDKHYTRDEKGRIIKISLPPNGAGSREVSVHYADQTSGRVAYTVYDYKIPGGWAPPGIVPDSIPCQDIDVYTHVNNRLVRINGGDTSSLAYTYTFVYDEKGNVKDQRWYGSDGRLCARHYYSEYDGKINPLYSGDEVRMLEVFWDIENISPNNVIRVNYLANSKHFEYRADGRPRSCIENGNQSFRIDYYYK